MAEANVAGYRALVEGFLGRGYEVVDHEGLDPARPTLWLRHDVDLDLVGALKMAGLEHAMGVRATYFLLLSSPFYNLSTRDGRAAIETLIELDHRIGLHFDFSVHPPSRLEVAARRECEILSLMVGRPVSIIAPHRPRTYCPHMLGHPADFAGRAHSYQPRYFLDSNYVSDGAGYWSHGHPLSACGSGGVQLLTHPYLWMNGSGGIIERVESVLGRVRRELSGGAHENFRTYAQLKRVLDSG